MTMNKRHKRGQRQQVRSETYIYPLISSAESKLTAYGQPGHDDLTARGSLTPALPHHPDSGATVGTPSTDEVGPASKKQSAVACGVRS